MTPVFTAAAPLPAPFASLSDEEVVARVIGGETALFEILMRRHNERIYRAARAIRRDDSEAEDVMQQAYVNAYRSEEHTSELQSPCNLVCRLLLEKKKKEKMIENNIHWNNE